APRLRPWVDQMLGRHRLRLTESGAAPVEVERTLWLELSRWLVDFEALPGFAVSAIAVTLEDEAAHEVDPGSPDDDELAPSLTPEQVVSDCEALLSDAAFALAWHCVDAAALGPGAGAVAGIRGGGGQGSSRSDGCFRPLRAHRRFCPGTARRARPARGGFGASGVARGARRALPKHEEVRTHGRLPPA